LRAFDTTMSERCFSVSCKIRITTGEPSGCQRQREIHITLKSVKPEVLHNKTSVGPCLDRWCNSPWLHK
jgi:hypothetical protein